MAKRISPRQIAEDEGYDDVLDYLEETGVGYDSVVPACCEDGCEVEPDGTCHHGHPSILLAIGVI